MVTIGVNSLGGFGHDASAALAIGGKIEYAIAEERLSRDKQDGSFPIRAIRSCLNYKGISLDEVDEVVFGWPKLREFSASSLKLNLSGALNDGILWNLLNYYRSRTTRDESVSWNTHQLHPRKVTHINHHLAHALSVLPYLGHEESLIFVIDGRGVSESTSVYLKKGFELKLLKQIDFPNSFGVYYAEMTSMCGFRKYSDEWKVMGLAPFGKKTFDLEHLISSKNGDYKVD